MPNVSSAAARAGGREQALERERLQWQVNELDPLGLAEGEWESLNAEQKRLSHAAALLSDTASAAEVKRLAAANPTGAIHNADNYRLFDYGSWTVGTADCSADAAGASGCDGLFKNSCLRDLAPSSCSMKKATDSSMSTARSSHRSVWKPSSTTIARRTPFAPLNHMPS